MRGRNREDVRRKLQGLVNHRYTWKAHLKTVTMRLLFDYWVVARDLKICDMIKVRSMMRKYQKGKSCLPIMKDIKLRIHSTDTLKRSEIQDMAQRHIVDKEAMSRVGKRYVNENTRVVVTKGKTIEGILKQSLPDISWKWMCVSSDSWQRQCVSPDTCKWLCHSPDSCKW